MEEETTTWLTPLQMEEALQHCGAVYYVFQHERGEETHKDHYQGFAVFDKKKRKTVLNKRCKGIHLTYPNGSVQQNVAYCTKNDTRVSGPWTYGEIPPDMQGDRTDLAEAIAILKRDGLGAVALQASETFVKYSRGLQELERACKPQNRPDGPFKVHLHYGDAGAGKSRHYHDSVPYDKISVINAAAGYWVDGFIRGTHVLIEDFDGAESGWNVGKTKTLLDRYVVLMPIKGGFIWWNPTEITITSNTHPSRWFKYSNDKDRAAIARRITDVTYYREGESPREVGHKDFFTNEHLYN